MLIFQSRQEQAYFSTLLPNVDPKSRKEVFGQYKNAMFPYIERTADHEKKTARDVLERAMELGPMVIDRRVVQQAEEELVDNEQEAP